MRDSWQLERCLIQITFIMPKPNVITSSPAMHNGYKDVKTCKDLRFAEELSTTLLITGDTLLEFLEGSEPMSADRQVNFLKYLLVVLCESVL